MHSIAVAVVVAVVEDCFQKQVIVVVETQGAVEADDTWKVECLRKLLVRLDSRDCAIRVLVEE